MKLSLSQNIHTSVNITCIYIICVFADDQVITTEDVDDVNYMFRKLIEEHEKWDLEITVTKHGANISELQ